MDLNLPVKPRRGRWFISAQSTRQGFFFLAGIGFLAKAIGFARETVTAHTFGVSRAFDLFLTIFMIPTIVFTVFTYAVSYALIPFYHRLQVERGERFASQYMNKLLAGSLAVGILIALSMLMLRGLLVTWVVMSGTPADYAFAVRLLRVLVWLMPLYFGICILQAILQAENYFLALSFGPLIQNISITLIILLFGQLGVINLAVSWLVGVFVWFCWLAVILVMTRKGADPQATHSEAIDGALLRVVFTSIILVVLVELWPQLYVIFDRLVVQLNHLPNGSIGSLSYATTLYTLGLSVFVISLGQAIFPALSAHAAAGRDVELNAILTRGFRLTILATLPITALLFIFGREMVILAFQRGQFDLHAANFTAIALRVFAIGLPLDSVYAILVGYLYAKRNFRILVIAGLVAFFAKVIGGIILVKLFGYLGFAISTVLATLCRTSILIYWLSQSGVWLFRRRGSIMLVLQCIGAALVGTLVLYLSLPWIRQGVADIIEKVALVGAAEMLIGSLLFAVIYGGLLSAMKIPEWVNLSRYLSLRMRGGGQ